MTATAGQDGGEPAEAAQRAAAGRMLLPRVHRLQHHGRHPDPHLRLCQGPQLRRIRGRVRRERVLEVQVNTISILTMFYIIYQFCVYSVSFL